MPNNKPGSRLIKAAGGVAWRPGPDGEPEVLLVHRRKYDDWSLPKGKAEAGEPLPITAVREVLEEGGVRLALGRRLVSVRYNAGGRPKRVHYWAARALSVDARAVPNSEVDEVAWLPVARAVDKVSYVHDHRVLADFAARPVQTVPLILLRHAKAVGKSGWEHADAARPLDDSGRSDAKALADLLACFSPSPRLISSTAVRCVDTLRPLSEATGEQVRVERSLYIHDESVRTDAADSGRDIAALVREVIASREPTVICAHRENLPALQEAALAALAGHCGDGPGSDTSGEVVPGDAIAELPREWDETLPTSGFWVLNVASPPAAPPKAPAPEPEHGQPPPMPSDLVAASPAAFRPWWRRLLRDPASSAGPAGGEAAGGTPGPGGPRRGPTAGSGTGDGVRGGEPGRDDASGAQPAGHDPGGPVGLLVSADRYDLCEP